MENKLETLECTELRSRLLLADMLTKSHSSPSLSRISSWAMGHEYLATLPPWNFEELLKLGRIRTLPTFLPPSFNHGRK